MTDTTKIAVAIIPGVGKRDQEEYEQEAIQPIQQQCQERIGDNAVIELIHWTPILAEQQHTLRKGFAEADDRLDFELIRHFFVGLITDIIAYQPQGTESHTYMDIHKTVATGLDNLARRAGGDAPLVIIAHSLGAVIASNYLRELQEGAYKSELVPEEVHNLAGDSPLERGETLAQMYTLGTFLALYSVRHKEFDEPMQIPAPKIKDYYPQDDLPCRWLNFYDRDDIFAFPLRNLNDAYHAVVDDRQVNVGGILESWNPLSHLEYWGDDNVVEPIVDGIVDLYEAVNR